MDAYRNNPKTDLSSYSIGVPLNSRWKYTQFLKKKKSFNCFLVNSK